MATINEYYTRLGGAAGKLGKSVGDEQKTAWGGLAQVYERGRIYSYPNTGVRALTGATLDTYIQLGGPAEIGYPLEDTVGVANGEATYFEKGCVWVGMLPSIGMATIHCQLDFPLIGRPAMVDPADPLTLDLRLHITALGAAASSSSNSVIEGLLGTLWKNRLSLQAVGKPRVVHDHRPGIVHDHRPGIVHDHRPGIVHDHRPGIVHDHRAGIVHAEGAITAAQKPGVSLRILGPVTANGCALIPSEGTSALQDRSLYDLIFSQTDGSAITITPHAFYVKSSWDNCGLIHATDLHASRRQESYRQKLLDMGLPEARTTFECFNDRARDLIREANRLHASGEVDGIIITGDLVDYGFEHDDDRAGMGNFRFFRDIILGRDISPDPQTLSEELRVPIFTVKGNHDYRPNPYQLVVDIQIAGGDVYRRPQFEPYNLLQDEASALQGRQIPNVSPPEAIKALFVDETLLPYAKLINNLSSYFVRLGKNRLVMLDTKWDATQNLQQDPFGSLREYISAIGGAINQIGVDVEAVKITKAALTEAAASGGAVIIGMHAPPIDVTGSEYPWYFRESLRNRPEVPSEVIGFLHRHHALLVPGGTVAADSLAPQLQPNWLQSLTSCAPYFKAGNLTDLVDEGVIRTSVEELMKVCTGKGAPRAADLILCGHNHKNVEIRVRWDEQKQFLLYMDCYSESPPHCYPTRTRDDRAVHVEIAPGGNLKPIQKGGNDGWASYWQMVAPPYPKPLTSTQTPQQAREWWQQHRPLVMQTAAIGPMENRQRVVFEDESQPTKPGPSFQGFRLLTIRDNTIASIRHVGRPQNRHLHNWGRRTLVRLADSGSAAGKVSELAIVEFATRRFLTAVRNDGGNLELITWSMTESGVITRTGDSGTQAGEASNIDVLRAGSSVVTSCRTKDGKLKLISWKIDDRGAIHRLGDSGGQAGEASLIRAVSVSSQILVTACKDGDGKLLLISWKLGPNGSLARLADSGNAAGAVNDVSLVSLPGNRVVTSVGTGSNTLKVIAWAVSPSGTLSRLGDSGEPGPEISGFSTTPLPIATSVVQSCVDRFGRVVTGFRDRDKDEHSGYLKLIVWEVTANGQVLRRSDSYGQVGKIDAHAFVSVPALGADTAPAILGSAVLTQGAHTLLIITWDVTRDGAIRRISQSGGVAGRCLALDIAPQSGALGGEQARFNLITPVVSEHGKLMLISWRAVSGQPI